MLNTEKTMEKVVNLCKNRGFVYAGSEIYGGLANTWDYGHLSVEFKNNVKAAWRKKFIQESPYNVGLDAAILMNPQTWVASGHLGGFSDPLMDCKECKERFRADKIIEDFAAEKGAKAIIKGLRAMSDFEYEFQMALTNKKLNPDADTVFLTSPAENMFLSSSVVKLIASRGGDISGFVPDVIHDYIKKRLSRNGSPILESLFKDNNTEPSQTSTTYPLLKVLDIPLRIP